MHKKNFLLFLFLLIAAHAPAQIITSKKEAIKKGVYEKPVEQVKPGQKAKSSAIPSTTKSSVAAKTASKPATIKQGEPIAANTKAPAPKTVPNKAARTVAKKPKAKKYVINDKEDGDLVVSGYEDYLPMQMINNAMEFLGVNYRGGGTTRAGMDCSGMVTAVFNIFDLKLPRSSRDMAKVGEKVDRGDVKKGDLVFFRTNGRDTINHVGIVIEADSQEIKFIHSSTQKGVIISSTKEPYYQRTFAQANRVL
jgi:cell wall-associated NlpC family hydrolase